MKLEQVQAVADVALRDGLSETTLGKLRANFKGVHFTYCMDDDVTGVEPFLRHPGMNVYLVDGRDHCLKLTETLEVATGLVLAEVLGD
jgi:hypothetical protein